MMTSTGIRGVLGTAVLAMVAVGSGCASRGYVRTQVGETAETLSAGINDNRESIDRTRQDLAGLGTEVGDLAATNLEQDQEIATTKAAVESTETEVASVRRLAEGAEAVADTADARSMDLARMFGDRSRFQVRESREIYFGFASSDITEEYNAQLQSVSDMLQDDPNTLLVLEGRTDATGDPAFNQQLGEERVDSVKTYLVMELGVPVYRIHGFSYGEARPDYDNESREEREKNRSVKLLVVGPASGTTIAALPE